MAVGHEVRVAAQRRHGANVEREQLPFAPLGDPPDDEWMPLMADFAELDFDTANARMIGEFFAGIDTRAALPGLLEIVEKWRPDVIVRESWEFASTIVAEQREISLARVALGLTAIERWTIAEAATAVDGARADSGLPPDPDGDGLRAGPYFTAFPEALDEPLAAIGPAVHRLRPAASGGVASLGDWWPGNDDPLVYLTFGSVTAGAHLPYFPALYRMAIEALALLPVRLLVTVGEDADPAALAPWPANVHVERWVPHGAVASRADVIVCHGGYGTTLGALAHGVPIVVLPLFSIDQWANAEAAARAGAGLALLGERSTRRVLDLPSAETLAELPHAVRRVLGDGAYRSAARRIAGEARALPPVEAAVDELAKVASQA
jgi:UDP:flavonoid glycosyltransferase YjiC (YdhE family)